MTTNPTKTGLVVNGNGVTTYGLFSDQRMLDAKRKHPLETATKTW